MRVQFRLSFVTGDASLYKSDDVSLSWANRNDLLAAHRFSFVQNGLSILPHESPATKAI